MVWSLEAATRKKDGPGHFFPLCEANALQETLDCTRLLPAGGPLESASGGEEFTASGVAAPSRTPCPDGGEVEYRVASSDTFLVVRGSEVERERVVEVRPRSFECLAKDQKSNVNGLLRSVCAPSSALLVCSVREAV